MNRKVKIEIQIIEEGSGATRSFSANWMTLEGQESIEQAFRFAFIEMISRLEAERKTGLPHRID